MRSRICYEDKSVVFERNNTRFRKKLIKKGQIGDRDERVLTLQRRSETIVRIPVDHEEGQEEGLIEKHEVDDGVVVANSLNSVKNRYSLTSVLNTNDHEVRIPEPRLVRVTWQTHQTDTEERKS
jgi:hypothetical protein